MDRKTDKNHALGAGGHSGPAASKSGHAGKPLDAAESSYGSEATTTLMIQAGQMPGEQVPVRGTLQPARGTLASLWAGIMGRWAARFGGKDAGP